MAPENKNKGKTLSTASGGSRPSWPVRHPWLYTFLVSTVIVWGAVLIIFIFYYPHIAYYTGFGRAILEKGFGSGPIPANTLYTEPQSIFENPLAPLPASSSKLVNTGVNRDTLLTAGWLDLSKGPQVLHVPDMGTRYYAVQFTDPSDGTDFAYVGTRTTGSQAGDYLISGPGWQGTVPQDMGHISSPNNAVLVIGRVLVESESDLPTAHHLTQQIKLTPLSQ